MNETGKQYAFRTTRRMNSIHPQRLSLLLLFICVAFRSLQNKDGVVNGAFASRIGDDTANLNGEELIIPVMLWDEFGNNAISTQPHPRVPFSPNEYDESNLSPRYLIARLAATTNNDNDNDNGNGLDGVQHITLDLGNPNEAIVLVSDCLGCDDGCETITKVKTNKLNQTKVTTKTDCCPQAPPSCGGATLGMSTLTSTPTLLFDTPDMDENHGVGFCWQSHVNDYLPTEHYSDTSRTCPPGVTELNVTNSTISHVCTQCFDDCDHSRFYTMSSSHSLAFLGVEGDDAVRVSLSGATAAEGFQFGALVRTVPLVDRVWGNVGIGYQSALFTQMNIESVLLNLGLPRVARPQSWSEHQYGEVILNPEPERYEGSVAQPYYYNASKGETVDYIDMTKKRLHLISSMTFDPRGNHDSEDDLEVAFHIDTGNNGIAIASQRLFEHLVKITHGEWKDLFAETNGVQSSRQLSNDERRKHHVWDNDGWNSQHKHGTREPHLQLQHSDKDMISKSGLELIVPFTPDNAPSLQIVFAPDIVLSLPGYVWVTSEQGHTIFETYHKNVLGLPLLSCTYTNTYTSSSDLDGHGQPINDGAKRVVRNGSVGFVFHDAEKVLYFVG
mmetsp:Transcript_3522/g.4055  ORF Transcript_3522/g.4055 Transcript_3522/m.4055 type:complete len:613 (-) Transcript_3522:270-2108(-)